MTTSGPAYFCSAPGWRPGPFAPFVPGKDVDPYPGAVPDYTFRTPEEEQRRGEACLASFRKNAPCDLGPDCHICNPRRPEAL